MAGNVDGTDPMAGDVWPLTYDGGGGGGGGRSGGGGGRSGGGGGCGGSEAAVSGFHVQPPLPPTLADPFEGSEVEAADCEDALSPALSSVDFR